jgi:hypothetical protein
MSDGSLLSGDPSGDGDATSTNSDEGFAMVNHGTISTATARVTNANVATWLQTQRAVIVPIETSPQNNNVSPYASKATVNTATIANQAETVPNPFKDDELVSSEATADFEVPTTSTKASPKAIIEDRATPTSQMFSTKVIPEEKAPNTSTTKLEATITPKIAMAGSQGSILFKQAVKGSKTSKTPAKSISGGKNEEFSRGSMPNHKLSTGPKILAFSVSNANLRHCVITISTDSFTMPSKISTGVDDRYVKQGIIGMLNDILWANVYLLDNPKSGFWKEVLRAASAKIPLALKCWVMVKGYTTRVKEILKMRNMLKRGNKKLFNGDAFVFTFSLGQLNWEYLGTEPDFQNLLVKRGDPAIVHHGFPKRSSKVPNPWSP